VYEGQNAFVSCDHMHRYREDFALMRLLGIRHYRFSISWSRLIPEGTGAVNEKGVDLYRDMIREMKQKWNHPVYYHVSLGAASGIAEAGRMAQ